MFKMETHGLGSLEMIRMIDPGEKTWVDIIPEFGGVLNSFHVADKKHSYELILGYESEQDIHSNKSTFRSSKLTPFPNRIAQGRYSWADKQFQLPVNFPSEGHAIHGLVCEKPFEVVAKSTENNGAELHLMYAYSGEEDGFPFSFDVRMCYQMFKGNRLKITTIIQNKGNEAIPIGDGWHPYLRAQGALEEMELKFPAEKELVVDNKMIPTGDELAYNQYNETQLVGNDQLDTCFSLASSNKDISSTWLCTKKLKIELWQERGEGKYNYLQVYTPQNRKSIAIEPMTCPPDAFNNGKDVITLGAQQSIMLSYGLNAFL